MTPDLTTLLASPCCPGCLRTATRIDLTPNGIAQPDIPAGVDVVVWVWPDGYTEPGFDCGSWSMACATCGPDQEEWGGEDRPRAIPTVRSLTPAAVLARLEAR
jgi:hypothetical protein